MYLHFSNSSESGHTIKNILDIASNIPAIISPDTVPVSVHYDMERRPDLVQEPLQTVVGVATVCF
jgi:hypothetical protein